MQRKPSDNNLPKAIVDVQMSEHRLELVRRFDGSPKGIDQVLKRFVFGQDRATQTVSVALYNHIKRAQRVLEGEEPPPAGPLSRVLLIGPSGSGKTHLARTAAGLTSLGVTVFDSSSITEAGYVGNSVDDLILRLLQNCYCNPDLSSISVICLDELDKCRTQDTHGVRDPSGSGAQASILNLLDGGELNVKSYAADRTQSSESFSARNTLIVGAGAFVGLESIIARRLKGRHQIGFSAGKEAPRGLAERQHILDEVTPQDLIDYGMLPELVGRFGVIQPLHPLSAEARLDILRKAPYGPVKTIQNQAELAGFRLRFTTPLLAKIIEMTESSPVGVRAMFCVTQRITQRTFYEVPDQLRRSRYAVPLITVGLSALADGSYTMKWSSPEEADEEPEDLLEA
jgi:ATP-dependent Clp protease ATP-binding subunit ClpX